jgi:hypothetical protein
MAKNYRPEIIQKNYRPNLVLDFDGCIAHYFQWQGVDIINEEPVEGAMKFIYDASKYFTINIFSSRSKEAEGIFAMQKWLIEYFTAFCEREEISSQECQDVLTAILWPVSKPAAFLTIDDRALCFDGNWCNMKPEKLLLFKPWNRQ